MLGFLFAKKYDYKFVIHLAENGKMKPSEIMNFIILAKKMSMILFLEVDF